jgi:hypothetical protein
MLFALVLGLLLGGAAVALLEQWRDGALAGPSPRRRLSRPTLPEPQVARVEGLFLDGAPAPAGRRRSAA